MANGMSGGYDGHSQAILSVMAVLVGLAWYNVIELIILIFITFTQYSGLYFWSLLVASLGVIPYTLGFLLKFYRIGDLPENFVALILISIGWVPMVTGQGLVLWSRLHLVLDSPRILRLLLYMIITNVFTLHVPTLTFLFGANLEPIHPRFVRGYQVYEQIQLSGFCAQEFILSGFYLREAIRMIRTIKTPESQRILWQLIVINVIMVMMDLALIGIESRDLYILQTTMKGAFYSIKLKLEFAVLRNLVRFITTAAKVPGAASISIDQSGYLPDYVDVSRIDVDVRHAPRAASRVSKHPYMDEEEVAIRLFEHSEVKEVPHEVLRPVHSRSNNAVHIKFGGQQVALRIQ